MAIEYPELEVDKYVEGYLGLGKHCTEGIRSLTDIFNLTGKTAIVTGGTAGLGYAIANRLAEAGASVVIVGRSAVKGEHSEKEFRERGLDVTWYQADITYVEECEKVVKFTEEKFGKVDILVNNASRWCFCSLVDQTEENYDKVMALNVKGTYFMCKYAARSMIENRVAGKIVNVASVASVACDCANLACLTTYNASKGAVATMTAGMAKELYQYGINVNCVSPGSMDTYGNADEQDGMVAYTDAYEDAALLAFEGSANQPFCNPDEVALMVFACCTDVANFTVGENIKVSGGAHLSHQLIPMALTMDIPEDYEPPRPIYRMSNFPRGC